MSDPRLLKAYGRAVQAGRATPGIPAPRGPGLAPQPFLYPINQGGVGAFPYRWEVPTGFNDYTYLYFDHGFSLDNDAGVLSTEGIYHDQYLNVLKAIDYKLSSDDNLALEQATTLRKAVMDTTVRQYETNFGAISATDWQKAGRVLGYAIGSNYDYLVLYVIAYVWSGAGVRGVPSLELKQWANAADPFAALEAVPADKVAAARAIVMSVVDLLRSADRLLEIIDARGRAVAALQVAIQSLQKPTLANGALKTIDDNGVNTLLPGWTVNPSVAALQRNLQNDTVTIQVEMTVEVDGLGSVTVTINDDLSIKTKSDPIKLIAKDGGEFDPLSFSGTGSIYLSTKVFKGKTRVSLTPEAVTEATATGWALDAIISEAAANGPKDVTGYYFTYQTGIDLTSAGPLGRLTGLEVSQFPTVDIYYKEGDAAAFLNSFPVTEKWDLSWLGLPKAANQTFAYQSTISRNTSGFTLHLRPDPALPDTGSLRDTAYVIGGTVRWPAG